MNSHLLSPQNLLACDGERWACKMGMNERHKIRIPQLKISAWYILLLCAISTMLTSHYLSMYGIVHWPILTSSHSLKGFLEEISTDDEAKILIKENDNLRKFFDALPDISEKINKSGWELMGKAGFYHIFGLVSFVLAIFALFCRPRWVSLIALPLGIYSMTMATVIM